MEKTVFIADQGTRYGRKISDTFLANNYRVISTGVVKDGDSIDNQHADQGMLISLKWNCFSPFSSKNVILGLRPYQDVRYSVIIFSSAAAASSAEEKPLYRQNHSDIQKMLDYNLRSQILITHDLIAELSKHHSSYLFFVLENSDSENPGRSFLKSFINTILADQDNLNITINAFEAGKETPEAFAEYFYLAVQDKALKTKGKWFRQFQMPSFLNSISMPGSH